MFRLIYNDDGGDSHRITHDHRRRLQVDSPPRYQPKRRPEILDPSLLRDGLRRQARGASPNLLRKYPIHTYPRRSRASAFMLSDWLALSHPVSVSVFGANVG